MENCLDTAELGDALVHDLAIVLDKNFGYKGSFAHSENRPDAPNPFLGITDIGPISLPISEIDAKRIIANATQAPFGLGTSTVIDKEVRDTWQIDPPLVSFQNPTWESFLQSNIASICSALGLPDGYDIQYKLHKLLLYETGSHFRPHQDTQKEDGMFATMVVVLPSQYTGGEIVVSHGSISKVIDVSASCMTGVGVLSWYTDVMHEVKPITSGYRLVLSYNLMRRSLSGPEVIPTADNTSELTRLHEVLERWRTGGYKQLPEQHMVAVVLGHQYSESDLDMGQAALKGQDAHKVNQICSVAQMLGFELWLAKYERFNLRGVEVEYDESDGEAIELGPPGDIIEDVCTLEYFTDLTGSRVDGKITFFDAKGLIMGDPYNMGDPDDEIFNPGYNGNEPASVEYYYHRAALVIFHKEDLDRVMIIARGAKYGLDKLQPSLNQDNPTPENRKIADFLLEYNTMSTSIWKSMAEFPLRWHDLDLWNRTIKRSPIKRRPELLITLKKEIFLAWDAFGFQQVQSSYEAIVSEIRHDKSKLGFIHDIKAHAASLDEREVVEAWCSEQLVWFVKGIRPGFGSTANNILISIAKEDGIKVLKDFEGQHCHSFALKKIIDSFMSEKENIYASPHNQSGSSNGEDSSQIFNGLLDKCIRGIIRDQDLLSTESGRISRLLEVVKLCITTNRVDECTNIFRSIWNARGAGDALKKLTLYYVPLTIRLSTRLLELGTTLLSPPFATFARNVIRYYLSQMLGSKTHNPRSSPPTLPCNQSCKTCTSLRKFFEQLYVPHQDFCVSRKTRKHFVIVLRRLSDFVSFTEVTRNRYRVAKYRCFLIPNRWEHRLEEAKNFLISVGDDDFIEQLMGDQFEDLKIALEGKSSYNYTGPLPPHEQQGGTADNMADNTKDDIEVET
ncbi:hypothetical protein M378DRAFT_168717 [Amanita muscaria Koide BX008]|uniref:Fe2OG dioxygenase domain-containing protein n=1 Tax=Amanita muscaria (strain Koide BX008) TaxID=946122 RepID=A0A0C2WT84_AMAMK|nr:hypothetical protein M378DRAFT_168717 [Amanita muscaria Koide BX008]